MLKNSQRGFAHILLILILLIGIVGGVYLVTSGNPLKLFSRAFNLDSVESLTNQLIEENDNLKQGKRSAQATSMEAIAFRRQEKLLEEIVKDPEAFINYARLASQREEFPQQVQQYLEEEKEIKGHLMVVHEDDFENNRANNIFSIKQADDSLVVLHFMDKNPPKIPSGTTVSTKAVTLKSQAALKDIDQLTVENNGRSAQDISRSTFGIQKIAALLVYFNTEKPGVNIYDARSIMSQLNTYYKENSLGQISFTADVFDDIAISGNHDSCQWYVGEGKSGKDIWSWTILADDSALSKGIPLKSYQRVIYIFPQLTSCSFAGSGTYGETQLTLGDSWIPSRVWIVNKSDNMNVYAHEIGHNLGVDHSNYLDCGSSAINSPQNCKSLEYGDIYDAMSWNSSKTPHFNGPHKAALGWIKGILQITQDGTYTIASPIEKGGGTELIKIQKPDTNEFYYLSYRQPIGLDHILPPKLTEGVSIHTWDDKFTTVSGIQLLNSFTNFIDTTPKSNEGLADAALSDGRSFFDPVNKISITQLEHNESSVQLSIKFNATPPPTPIPTLNPTSTPIPVIPVFGEPKWQIRTSLSCVNGNTPKGKTRLNLAHWPLEKYDLNNPITWYKDGFGEGEHVVSVSEEPKSTSVYFGLETEAGEWLEPINPQPTENFTGAKFFYPQKWMIRMNKLGTFSQTYSLKYYAPEAWCN